MYMLKIVIFDIFCAWCVRMCAYNMPDVCTYFGVCIILKYRLFLFQRTPSRIYTTKTRFCNYIYIFSHFARKVAVFRKKKYASFKQPRVEYRERPKTEQANFLGTLTTF